MFGLEVLLYDKDVVYTNINNHLVQFSKDNNENSIVTSNFLSFVYFITLH